MIKVNGKEIVFETFPNGETHLKASSFSDDVVYRNVVSFKYENDSDLIKLMLVKNFIDSRNTIFPPFLTMYHMPYSRMDRSENGSPFTLKYVANFINSLEFKKVTIVEPHSDVTPALINHSESIYVNFDLIERVKKEVGFDNELDYLMFPDAGAGKRYSKMKNKNVIIGNKDRDFETGKITKMSLQSEFDSSSGKVIIVDDLSSYGGTFVMSAEALRKEGFKEIYLLVAHAENAIFDGKLFDHMTKVFTTDSMLTKHTQSELIHQDKLRVYDIEEVLSKKERLPNE